MTELGLKPFYVPLTRQVAAHCWPDICPYLLVTPGTNEQLVVSFD